MAELDGKVALVTGAASGIGEASARALAAAGAKVVVAALHEDKAKVVSDSINEGGGDAMPIGFDTSNEQQVKDAMAAIAQAYGGVDILHNNAAITSVDFMMRDGMVHELDVDLWDQTMAVNVRGYMLCTKHAVPLMLARGGGAIINTASGAGMQGEIVRPAYGTSKAAVIGFTRSVATQYGKMGIRCNTVMPGLTMTATVAANVPPAMLEMMKRHTLTPEMAGPEAVASAVAFLASDRASFITGALIPVDGGFSAHGPSYADESAMWAAMSGAAGVAAADKFRQALEARGHTSLSSEDAALLGELFAPDVASTWTALAASGAKAQVVDVYADATHVIGVVDYTRNGSTVRQANVLHLNDDGKATEVWEIPTSSAIQEAFAASTGPVEHPNAAIFRAAEEARARNEFNEEDLGLITAFLRDDVKWISPWGKGPESRDEVVAQFGMFNQATGGTLQLTLYDVFADETHAVSLVRLEADRPDKPDKHMNAKEANVFHLDGNGQAFEFWGVAEDQASINAFWT